MAHVGKVIPRCNRPDFSALVGRFDCLPRRMVMTFINGSGTYVTPWNGKTVRSELFEMMPDGQTARYLFHHPTISGASWEYRSTLIHQTNPAMTQGDGFQREYKLWQGASVIAFKNYPELPANNTWYAPWFATSWLPDGTIPWTKFVSDAEFSTAFPKVGSGDWSMNTDYEPYNARP